MTSPLFRTLALGLSALALAACADDATDAEKEAATMAKPDMTAEDPNLWLEEVEGEEALAWVRAENDRTLAELEADSRYEPWFDEAMAILTSDARIPGAALRGGYAYNFWQDETHVRGIYRRMPVADYVGGGDDWETVLDVDALADAEDENWVYSGMSCFAPEYDRCMVTLSRGGSDAAVRREYLISEGRFVEGGFALPEAKASVAWVDQDTVMVGTDFGEGTLTSSGYPRTTRLWKRGTPLEDAPVIFEGEESDVAVWPLTTYSDGSYKTGLIRSVTFFESEYYWADADGEYVKLPIPMKANFSSYVQGQIIVRLNEDWTHGGETFAIGSVVAYDPVADSAVSIFAPSDRVAVSGVSSSENAIFIQTLDNIVGKLSKFSPGDNGWTRTDVALPDNGVVSVGSVDDSTGDMLVYYENPMTPDTLYYVADGAEPKPIKSQPSFFDADGMVTMQHEAVSTDGTRIPYFVMAKQSVLDAGPAPTIQYGYGGFQISMLPNYSATTGKMWLESGGVYVIANIRGGGEFGPAWHQAGLKQNRQKIYDDFFAVSEDLIERGITTTDQLGILGGSNGGLLMGVSMVQRPDLYKAVGIGVPLLDMLRYHKLLAGASWIGEYGDPDVPEERAFLETISPYQNIDPEGDYPRPYFFTSTKDDRVHPGHARKMAKKMQDYGMPFLYFENIEGGHGAAANQNQRARRLALQYVYFAHELGLK